MDMNLLNVTYQNMFLRRSNTIFPGQMTGIKLEQNYGKSSSSSKVARFIIEVWEVCTFIEI